MKDVIFNPIFNDTVTFLKTSAETNGEYSKLEVALGPNGGNPPHRHAAFEETFTVKEGELGLMVNGKNLILKSGEKMTVLRGQIHRFFNPRNKEVKFHLEFTPGHTGAENMLRIVYGLAEDGKTDSKGIPKNLFITALL